MTDSFRAIKVNGAWALGIRQSDGRYHAQRTMVGYRIFDTKEEAQQAVNDARSMQEVSAMKYQVFAVIEGREQRIAEVATKKEAVALQKRSQSEYGKVRISTFHGERKAGSWK